MSQDAGHGPIPRLPNTAEPVDLRQALSATLARVAGAEESDPNRDQLLELVDVTARAGTETRSLLGEAVTSARAAGASWDAIGRVLGMSRQAAHQRFGRPRDQDDTPGTRDPRPGHRVLRDGGPAGRRPSRLALGGLRRIPAHPGALGDAVGAPPDPRRGGRDAHPPRGGGLGRSSATWFPWVYLKRDTGTPALPGGLNRLRSHPHREPGNRCATCRKPDGPTIGPWPTSSRTTDSGPPGTRCWGAGRGPWPVPRRPPHAALDGARGPARARGVPRPQLPRPGRDLRPRGRGTTRSRSTPSRGSSPPTSGPSSRRASSSGSEPSRRSSPTSTTTPTTRPAPSSRASSPGS